MSDMAELQLEVDKVIGLIDEGNKLLDQPASHLREDYEKCFSRLAPKLAAQLSKLVSRGRIEEIIIAGIITAVCWFVAVIIDFFINLSAESKAHKALLGYYQELAVKHNLLVEQYKAMNNRLVYERDMSKLEKDELGKKLSYMEDLISRISIAQQERTV